MRPKRLWGTVGGLVAAVAVFAGVAVAPASAKQTSSPAVQHDTSPPLRDIPAASSPPSKQKKEHPKHGVPLLRGTPFDPVVQSTPGAAAAPLGSGGAEFTA
jgi:hypothetical protein